MNPTTINLFLAILIQTIGFFIVVQILTGRMLKWKEGLVVMVCAIASIPLFLVISYWVNLILIAIFALALLYKKQTIFLSITVASLTFIISILSDYLFNNIFLVLIKIPVSELYNHALTTVVYAVSMMLIACLIAYVLKKVIDKWNLYTYINQKKYGFITVAIVLLTLLIYHLNIFFSAADGFVQEIVRLNTVIFLAYFAILIGMLYLVLQSAVQEIQMKNQQEQFVQLQEYTSTLETLHNEMRVFRHDYINILSSMAGYIDENDMEGLKIYFEKNIAPINHQFETNDYKISSLQNIHVTELKGLIAIKLIRAQELNIDAIVEVVEGIDKINMPSVDLCKAVGILLDNAVEAALESDNPTIRVAIFKKEEATEIVFANSVPANMPPLYKIFEDGFSTKGTNRGIGLSSLKETLQKYPNVTLDTKLSEREFIQELEIV
ncbi:accessory gene regulator protein C [Listeria floridensis FSL S10-1187]|uniref:Accessory gene regulator protein C n=1 Tax=Listeria floridensis FSL S10-1187 TaxID=1265817 RepID=A0ABP3AXF7_9LIST|nr:GHKL domain-containing protein [Listeria floridensis]EUJ30998.1 accessory gene regulator protein C [Listeria floridensis FSL S10-1187]